MDVSTRPASLIVFGPTAPARSWRPRDRFRVACAAAAATLLASGVLLVTQSGSADTAQARQHRQISIEHHRKAQRLDARVDVAAPAAMSRVHAVTGTGSAAAQARTRAYQDLRDHTDAS